MPLSDKFDQSFLFGFSGQILESFQFGDDLGHGIDELQVCLVMPQVIFQTLQLFEFFFQDI